MSEQFLDRVYGARDEGETRALYDKWAASYETEVSQNGYATPGRCAKALADITADQSAPLLDFGCGTGLSGLALKLAGFENIDGVDLSLEMLAQARSKGVYRDLEQVTAGFTPAAGVYSNIAAIGVIGSGAAPVDALDTLMKALPSGGRLVFSFNDHTLEDPVFEARVSEWTDCGAARLLFRERGDHLPGRDMKSIVYILEKA
ncbi:Methyltransferase-like protein [Sulfitobacter noctilucicola]|uniref:Putative TPR repeat methyltransferase n=1 Tax=Sulfitobacter noctilucicola TaxID=1342301 RepID=A0A7W6M7A3_9RHOB|nr:methyltransferase domain-containing protein [Sulfitobacter noctilucicola]KIN65180.1 Methyltransferase-like protein [Sulfitobacter noctilucicola]MBB4173686.1 putative TPR repeat methyltransferase [Sulfitobacter noctilucicola]